MNEQDNATPEVATGDADTPPPTERYISRGDGLIFDNNTGNTFQGHDLTVIELNQLQAIIAELRTQLDRARYTQIMGDDHRLTEFWEKAQELADRAGHCSVYDEIAEALGGPAREREYDVTFTYSTTYTVTARDEETASDWAQEQIEDNYTIGDLHVDNVYVRIS